MSYGYRNKWKGQHNKDLLKPTPGLYSIEFENPFAGEDTLIPIMTDEEGYVEFSDLMFSVYGKAGKYTLEFVCEGVSLISKEIIVTTSISKVKFTS